MKRLIGVLLWTGISLGMLSAVDADRLIDNLKSRLALFRSETPFFNLYVHLDKNNYLTSESIWFKAYVLAGPDMDNKVLFVRLADKDKKVILSYQFPVYDIRSNGDILLPDSLKEGEYYFYAFTSGMVNFNPDHVFVQKINVYKNTAETMEAEAMVTDSSKLQRGGNVNILVKIKKGTADVAGIKGTYGLLVDDKPIKRGTATTNSLGEANIAFIYPQIDDDKTVKIKALFDKDDDKAELNLNLRHEGSPVTIMAYPEGGHLIAGIVNHIAVVAEDGHHNPVAASFVFQGREKIISQLTTDQYGTAAFSFIPEANTPYFFGLTGNGNKKPVALTTKIEQVGVGLRIKKMGSRYFALICNKGESESLNLVIRNYDNVLWNKSIALRSGDSTKISLPVDEYPKQILSLALFEPKGTCAAERLFLNKQLESYQVTIRPEKQIYGQRQKVKVSIDAKDLEGNPIAANLSVAVVEKTRINNNNYTTILDAYYYNGLISAFPGQNYHTADDIDAILITKKWWGGGWPEILNYKPGGPALLLKNSGGIAGKIVSLSHGRIDVHQLFIYSKSHLIGVEVNKDGTFNITPDNLIADQSERRYLLLAPDFYDRYTIQLHVFEDQFDAGVKNSNALAFPERYNTFVKLNDRTGINLKGTIQLKEVVIKDVTHLQRVRPDFYPVFKSVSCNDYVCIYNLLNCPWHPTGTIPVEGGIYNYNGHNVVYHGCNTVAQASNNILLKNISLPHTFILPDYDKEPMGPPELRSTIYWEPNLYADKAGKISFEFFTSDVKGDFTIVAQGVDKNFRPIYAQGGFTVK